QHRHGVDQGSVARFAGRIELGPPSPAAGEAALRVLLEPFGDELCSALHGGLGLSRMRERLGRPPEVEQVGLASDVAHQAASSAAAGDGSGTPRWRRKSSASRCTLSRGTSFCAMTSSFGLLMPWSCARLMPSTSATTGSDPQLASG